MSSKLPEARGAELYDALYSQRGYHGQLNLTRSRELQPAILNASKELRLQSFLDVGCSHGWIVQWLWQHNFRASGADISHVAINMAKDARGEPSASCVLPCFAQANPARGLPWANDSFDAVVSSDALEHIEPADVRAAASEISRVATKALVLKVSNRNDVEAQVNVTNGTQGVMVLPRSLHPTVRWPSWWLREFQHVDPAWKMLYSLPPARKWACCTFVLWREQLSARAR